MRKPSKFQSDRDSGAFFLLIIPPWFLFTFVTMLFAFLGSAVLAWIVVVACCILSILVVGSYAFTNRRAANLVLGCLSLLSCVCGTAFGAHLDASFFQEYSRLKNGATFHNVQPGEAAEGHADAAVLHFSVGTMIDTTRAVGFKDGGVTYCVSPILDAVEAGNTEVQYWAVGTDCCMERNDFECDDAAIPQTRSAIQIPEDDSSRAGYLLALKQVSSIFGLSSAEGALFLRWIYDPDTLQSSLLWQGRKLFCTAIFLYLLSLVVVMIVLSHVVKLDRKEFDVSVPGMYNRQGPTPGGGMSKE